MKKTGFKQSRASARDYFEWRINRANPAINRVQSLRKLSGLTVLDIGCGYGALCSALSDVGANVFGIEVDEDKLNIAASFLSDRSNIELIRVESETLPFTSESFDVVFLFDVIEHISNPGKTIEECDRVLKTDGILYVEFTPYYSITGHHLYDYAKWPIHILPERYIKKIVYSKQVKSFLTADDFWKQFKSLNKLRVSKFQELVKHYRKIEERLIVKYPERFEANLPFLNLLGPLKDTFAMSFEGIYLKQWGKDCDE